MKRLPYFILVVLCASTSFGLANSIYKAHSSSSTLAIPSFSQLPEETTGVVSLEFKSVIADYIMLHVLTFMGEKVIREAPTNISEWKLINKALENTVYLDPRATDPFILAATTLPFEAGMVKEANALLEVAAKYRPNDYRPNFFLWYNYQTLLNDPVKGLVYLKKAASTSTAPAYLIPLVSRMQLYTGQIEASIAYTLEAIKATKDDSMRKYLTKRLEALKQIAFLENKIQEFKDKYGSTPKNIEDLISSKIVEELPLDPYGGNFFINEKGRVYSTSKLIPSLK